MSTETVIAGKTFFWRDRMAQFHFRGIFAAALVMVCPLSGASAACLQKMVTGGNGQMKSVVVNVPSNRVAHYQTLGYSAASTISGQKDAIQFRDEICAMSQMDSVFVASLGNLYGETLSQICADANAALAGPSSG